MIRKHLGVVSIIIVVCIGIFVFFYHYKAPNQSTITLSVFQSSNGWGYEIKINKKPFIYQQYIPAISGYKAFSTKEKAILVGEMVVEKIKNHKIPSISEEELKKMGIVNDSLKVN